MREQVLGENRFADRETATIVRPLQDPFDVESASGAALSDKGEPEPQFFLPPPPGSIVNGLPVLSWDQGAAQLTRGGYSWNTTNGEPVVITYAFRASVPLSELQQLPAGVSGFTPFNAIQIAVAEEIMRLWSEVANIQLVRVGSGTSGPGAYSNNATILLGNFTTGPAAFSAFAYLPSPTATSAADVEGNVWVNVSRNYDADPLTFSQGAQILVHEIGHTLGLLHPADYGGGANGGATYNNDATFWQDTSQFMTMSYFNPAFTGANWGINARAPQLFDIAAAQLLYGANMTTRTGDSVYGFNSNTGHSVFTITAANAPSVFTIWDAGGVDTLDLSGYATASEIDLREEAFSSAGPGNGGAATYNLAIARGAVIENAIGGSGNDLIIGNEADNVLTGNAGADALSGNGGTDTARYENSNAAVSVNLATGSASGGHAQGDTFQSIESVRGSAFNDTLTGDASNNVLSGLNGADVLSGGGGDDQLLGAAGNDVIAGGTGNDLIGGGGGDDTILWNWGDGHDVIDNAGDGFDTLSLTGSAAADVGRATWDGAALTAALDVTLTGPAMDVINLDLGTGADWLVYTASAAVSVDLAMGAASGFTAIAGVERVIGGSGADSLIGDGLDNRLEGGAGDDALNGGGGIDALAGGEGDDVIAGGAGNDSLQGLNGADTFVWSAGDGRDTVNGGADNDTFNLTGAGVNEIAYANWTGSSLTGLWDSGLANLETINLNMAGGDDWLIYNTAFSVAVNLALGTGSGFSSIANVERIIAGGGDDALMGDGLDNRLDGGAGADALSGGGGVDSLFGGDGADVIDGGAGNDSLDGGAGADIFNWAFADGRDTFRGGADSDTLNMTGSGVNDVARVNWNGASITGLFDNAVFDVEAINLDMGAGAAAGDWLSYNASTSISVDVALGAATGFASIAGVENVIGGSGADDLVGDSVSNKILGGLGDDVITGGGGADNLTGGLGSDTFVYAPNAGADTINDFDAWAAEGQDFLDLAGLGVTSGDFASRVTIIDTGNDTVVRIDGSIFITLKNVTGDGDNSISAADFILG